MVNPWTASALNVAVAAQLDGDVARELLVEGVEHDPHAALAQRAPDPVLVVE